MKPINEKLIQFTGKVPVRVDKDYETGDELTVVLKGDIYNTGRSDNHDGTDDLIFKLKATDAEIAPDSRSDEEKEM